MEIMIELDRIVKDPEKNLDTLKSLLGDIFMKTIQGQKSELSEDQTKQLAKTIMHLLELGKIDNKLVGQVLFFARTCEPLALQKSE